MRIVVAGFGSVGRSLISLILERGLWRELRVVAVIDSRAAGLMSSSNSPGGACPGRLLAGPGGGLRRC